jgi:glycosyltransferase involved in cell wall biosynthesis
MLVSNACGPDRRVLREARALVDHGNQVTVIAWDRAQQHQPAETVHGVQIDRIQVAASYGAGMRRLARWPAFAGQALSRLSGNEWDVVHCHDLDTLPVGYLYTRWPGRHRSRPRLIFDAHESYPDLMAPRIPRWAVAGLRLAERRLVGRVDGLITVGDLLADHFRRWAKRVVVVRNCPASYGDASATTRLYMREELGETSLLVSYVGGFTRGRVLLPLIEAIKADPVFGLVLVGDGPQAPQIHRSISNIERIRYLGSRIPPEEVVRVMQATDVVYYGLDAGYPNNRYSSPNALYAALAASRPLLTTDVGEIAQIVREEECGFVLEHATAEHIGTALTALRDPGLRAKFAENAWAASVEKYNWPVAQQNLLRLYEEVCE